MRYGEMWGDVGRYGAVCPASRQRCGVSRRVAEDLDLCCPCVPSHLALMTSRVPSRLMTSRGMACNLETLTPSRI